RRAEGIQQNAFLSLGYVRRCVGARFKDERGVCFLQGNVLLCWTAEKQFVFGGARIRLHDGLEAMRDNAGEGLVKPGVGSAAADDDAVYAGAAPYGGVAGLQKVWQALLDGVGIDASAPMQLCLGACECAVVGIPVFRVAHRMFVQYGRFEAVEVGMAGGVHDHQVEKAAFADAFVAHGGVDQGQRHVYGALGGLAGGVVGAAAGGLV